MNAISFEFETPTRGKVFFKGEFLANFFQLLPDCGKYANKWNFNRDKLAFDLGIPPLAPFDSLEAMQSALDNLIGKD